MRGKKQKKAIKSTNITDLIDSNFLQILCLLPMKSIIMCRCVCKDWANLISQPSFPTLYSSTTKISTQLLFPTSRGIVVVDLDEDLCTQTTCDIQIQSTSVVDQLDLHIARLFNIQRSFNYIKFLTCNTTCWIVAYQAPQVYIYNMITGTHFVLPENNTRDGESRWSFGCAVCFSQKSNRLKFLQLYKDFLGISKAEIHTIGTNDWRSLGESPRLSHRRQLPVFVQGFYHWLENGVIHCFDAEQEVFRSIQTPSNIMEYGSEIGSLEGCLCISQITSSIYNVCEFWVMKDYGNQDSWTMKFAIVNFEFRPYGLVQPLTCFKNGEVVILYGSGDRLICCNPKTNIEKSEEYRNWRYISLQGLI